MFDGFTLVFWHWWILAVLLMVAEVFAPGVFFLWFGLAAVATGFVALLLPDIGWQAEGLTFAVLAVAAALIGKRVYARNDTETDQPGLNRRAAQYLGQTYRLDSPIEGGQGRMRLGDGSWKISGPDLPAGTLVKVVGAEGTVLKVEAAE
ncbi:NfeD family protein [Telmatospirillum sp. J64-1]|uniref:NfeD family protein n=1 Tax=Telmatospirillum sp. J64-1 TaxID=2502183 RepID=UPI00115E26AE|nr:NfeD family protein [Telmatospirillum sp. J64-1]